jgi:5'-3' exonuclease
MGIPSFFVHAVRTYKRIVKPIKSLGIPVSNLYMDCNGLIYNAVRDVKLPSGSTVRAAYESAVIQHVCDAITSYVRTVAPTNSVFIAFDGVAPSAKLNQQRERRYKTWLASAIDTDILHASTGSTGSTKAKVSSSEAWSTACITPGTEFMSKLHVEMTRYRDSQASQFPNLTFMLSTSAEPGEGEHKIFEHIRAEPEKHRDQVTLVYGLDADLIMLTLNHLHISNRIFLYRETPEFIRSIDSSLRPNEQYYVDIPYMADSIAQHITVDADAGMGVGTGANTSITIDTTTRKHLVYDYVFMFFMMGNDFMPHFPSMNIRTTGPSTVVDAYRTVFKNRLSASAPNFNHSFIEFEVEGKKQGQRPRINWSSVRMFVDHLAASEHNRLIDEHALRNKKCGGGGGGGGGGSGERVTDMKRDWGDNYDTAYDLIINKCESSEDTLHLPSRERGLEFYIAPNKPDWERRYYHALFDAPISDKRCKKYCMNYLEGLEWTFTYYTYGCIDWKWKYNYMYPPLLQDLARFIPAQPVQQQQQQHQHPFLLVSSPPAPITPQEQLEYVLPPALQCALIPNPELSTISTTSTQNRNHSDDKVKRGLRIKWAYCKYFWEAHLHYE